MALYQRLLFLPLLAFLPFLSLAQQPAPSTPAKKPAAARPSFTGHYQGTAKNKAQQLIPLAIDLTDEDGAFSGTITTSQGVYPIVGGTRRSTRITIIFDAAGEVGSIAAKLADSQLTGTFTLGDDSGSVDARKTADEPRSAAPGKSPLATPILILGVYHMHNPGLDAVNPQADDVLAPQRQAEIEELVQHLARFQPTKIAIEAEYRDPYWPAQYQKYLVGDFKLGRNEIEQIAFPLAKRLNLKTLYGVDFPMFMNGLTLTQGEDHLPGKTDSSDAPRKSQHTLSPEDELLRKSSVEQYLLHLNSAAEVKKNHEQYMAMLLPGDESAPYKKADLVANWYKRNLLIFTNINRINDPGKDRILVIIGAGHLKLLREFAADSPFFNEVPVEPFLTAD
jgi:Family of unknown function (DUF5694)